MVDANAHADALAAAYVSLVLDDQVESAALPDAMEWLTFGLERPSRMRFLQEVEAHLMSHVFGCEPRR
jgi:hypothetical protein